MHIVVGDTALHPGKDLAVSPHILLYGLTRRNKSAGAPFFRLGRLCSHLSDCSGRALPATLLPALQLGSVRTFLPCFLAKTRAITWYGHFNNTTNYTKKQTPHCEGFAFTATLFCLCFLWFLCLFMCVSSFCHKFLLFKSIKQSRKHSPHTRAPSTLVSYPRVHNSWFLRNQFQGISSSSLRISLL